MDEFIARLNIEHYRDVLAAECDPERRRLIERLLAEEEVVREQPAKPLSWNRFFRLG